MNDKTLTSIATAMSHAETMCTIALDKIAGMSIDYESNSQLNSLLSMTKMIASRVEDLCCYIAENPDAQEDEHEII